MFSVLIALHLQQGVIPKTLQELLDEAQRLKLRDQLYLTIQLLKWVQQQVSLAVGYKLYCIIITEFRVVKLQVSQGNPFKVYLLKVRLGTSKNTILVENSNEASRF